MEYNELGPDADLLRETQEPKLTRSVNQPAEGELDDDGDRVFERGSEEEAEETQRADESPCVVDGETGPPEGKRARVSTM